MRGIWIRVVPVAKRRAFFAASVLEWMYGNLNSSLMVGDYAWSTFFAIGLWWGWKWRCGNVFGENRKCRDRVKFLKDLAGEAARAHNQLYGSKLQVGRVERLIAWKRPEEGWLKLNTDGASRGNPGTATAGGVMRDEEGRWCAGFAVNIGICSAPLAELWGVYYGLYIAWEHGATRVALEVDSEIVVGFLRSGIVDTHPLSFLVHLCHGFISRDWIVRVTHVYREANRLADGLANYAFSLPLGFHSLSTCPRVVDSLVFEDVVGLAHSRLIRL